MGVRGPKPKPAVERVLRRTVVNDVTGCWEWMGALNRDGYGLVGSGFPGELGVERLVHRVVYTAKVAPIPEGLVLDHLCRNRRCVNPAHLEPVTKSENLKRSGRVGKWNALKTECPKCGGPFEIKVYAYKTQRWCRPCTNIQKREYDQRQPKKMLTCEQCGVEFPKNAGRPARRCADCRK